MNKWRRTWDAFRQDGSPEDLVDINEQELAKDTSASNASGAFDKKGNDGNAGERSGKETRIEANIVKADENKSLMRIERSKNTSEKERASAKDFGEFGDMDRLEKSTGASAAFFKTVVILSALASVLIFAFVALGAYSEEDEDTLQYPDFEATADSEAPLREGDRVIYIRDLDDDSGVMSTAEIYEENRASVVTVLAMTDSGTSVGTGFILSSDGYIATACHTLEGADDVRVLLADGRRVEAQLVGEDELSDLALLRVYSDRLSPVSVGDSDKLVVGEPIVAIGTPYSEEFSGSVFSGSVSSVNRIVSVYDDRTGGLEKKMNLVQLSATLGKGCSGCPIFDEYGRVIGILSSRLGDGTSGVCFAIPINGATMILDAIKANGDADGVQDAVATSAPRLGILGSAVNEGGVRGVKIGEISDGARDAATKLRVGDIIVSVGDRETHSSLDVSEAISRYLVGERVLVTVYRSGQYLSFDVELTK